MPRLFLARDNRFLNDEGSASVEFTIVLIPFLASLLFIMELCRVMYLTAAVDLVLAESGRYISLEPAVADYSVSFNKMLNDNIVLWPLLSSGQSVDVSVYHCDKISDLLNITSSCTLADDTGKKVLAIYSVTYHYKPLFFFFSAGHFDSLFIRRVVYIQEAKRG
ncbi:TadE/TadG family type IV pilus assembly protein [Salmonella enterica]